MQLNPGRHVTHCEYLAKHNVVAVAITMNIGGTGVISRVEVYAIRRKAVSKEAYTIKESCTLFEERGFHKGPSLLEVPHIEQLMLHESHCLKRGSSQNPLWE